MQPTLNEGDITPGMPVYGLDGVLIGTVGIVDATSPEPGDERHFSLNEHPNVSVPFADVVVLFPGQSVTLGCSVAECLQLYVVERAARPT